MNQFLPEKKIVDAFVGKMSKHWNNWHTGKSNLQQRLNDLTTAINEICLQNRVPCHEILAPKVSASRGKTVHFNAKNWQIEADSNSNTQITENKFAEILTSAFEGLQDAELRWYAAIADIITNSINGNVPLNILIQYAITEPAYVYQSAFDHIKRVGSRSINTTINCLWKPRTIAELVSDSCRQRGIKVTSHQASPLSPNAANGGFNWNVFNTPGLFTPVNGSPNWGMPIGVVPVKPLSLDLKKPCFAKEEFKKEKLKTTLSKWTVLRNQPTKGTMKEWKHIVHMDYRILLDPDRPNRISPASSLDLLVNGRFPNDWKKISASLISNEMPNWTYIYRRYYNGSNHGGGLRVGYILDVPSQNILSTSPEDVASINSEKHIKNCRLHYGGNCEIACYIKHNTIEQLGKHHPKAVYALNNLLDPDTLLTRTHNCPNRAHQAYHHNEMLIMCREGTNRTEVYENIAPIGDVKAKAVYLVIDERDTLPDINSGRKNYCDEMRHDVYWAEKIAVKHNLPIFQVHINTAGKVIESIYRLPSKKAIEKAQRPHFSYLNTATKAIITDKLSKWDPICKAPAKEATMKKGSGSWQYIVHMDQRVLTGTKPLLTSRKFPSDWKKISASLVTDKAPDWTYFAAGKNPIRVGYILDVPPQNILSTNAENIFSIESETHIANCKKKHQSGGCHILCYVEAKAKNRGGALNAFESILSPEELLSQQKKYVHASAGTAKQNELIILGPGTPDRVLYKGVPRTSEVKVKGIYLVVSQKDNPHNRERDRKWAEREAKRNANRKDGKLPIFTVHI